ncbi:MAG: DnaB-like helicase N-terminal domain-containing protein, partial [Pseudomonadota bacterium]
MADGAELPATGGLPAVPPGGPDAVPAEVGDGGLVQPHNIEMEQALLGALLVQNEVYAQVEGTLRPEHFYDPYHRRIYEKIQGLIQKRLLATPVTLKSFLVEEPGYEEMGGAAYLVALAEHVVSLRAVPDYAAALRELAMRRDLVAIGDDIRWRAARFDTDEPPDNQIALAEQQLYTLAETGTAMGGFKPFLAGMTEAVKQAQLARQRGSDIAGLSTGLKALDEAIGGLRNSDLLILAARPSMGKTALALNIAYAVARQRLRDTID